MFLITFHLNNCKLIDSDNTVEVVTLKIERGDEHLALIEAWELLPTLFNNLSFDNVYIIEQERI